MKIGKRLTIQFTIIVGLILISVLVSVYLFMQYNAEIVFYERLKERCFIAANLFLEKDELSKERIQGFEKKFANTLRDERIQFYNEKKQVVYSSDKILIPLKKSILDKVTEGEELLYEEDGRQYFIIDYKDNQGSFIIEVSAIDKIGEKKMQYLLVVCISAYIFALLFIYAIGKRFARKALHPIKSMVTQVKSITLSNLSLRISDGKNKDEIDELANTFNTMLQSLQNALEVEKTFVSNASHELRTPLTSIIGELQVLLSKERETETYRNTANIILEQSIQMKEVLNSLLLLSQVQDSNFIHADEDVRVDELLFEIAGNVNTKYASKPVQVELNNLPDDPSQLNVKGNKFLLYSAISNLIENGVKFSSGNKVVCTLCYINNKISIEVTDKGIGIPESDLKQLFHPFFRADNARSFKGHGIGLSLSYKIIQHHRGQIHVSSRLNEGTTFLLIFNRN